MNRDKVVKGLECIAEDRQKSCTGCEYSIFGLYSFCVHGIARDALALLKKQEPIPCGEKIKAGDVVLDFYECGYCKKAIRKPWKYCPFCGKAVMWK